MTRHRGTGDGTSLAERKARAGQRLWIGFEGHAIDDTLREIVGLVRPSGFVLFARNVADPAQVRELARSLRDLAAGDHDVVLSVDQEGGRVQRVRSPATVWPAPEAVARAGDLTEDVARAVGRELRAMDLDLDFAPVADLRTRPDDPVIGDRAFGRDPEAVARHVAAFTRGLQREGIAACAKHFPGHGDTTVDSHHDLPTIAVSRETLRDRELRPFAAAVEAGVASVMTAHVVFPALDVQAPATLSPAIVPRLLRRDLGFDGLVISDDLDMKAVADRWPVDDQAEGLVRASVDVLLACRDPERQVALFEALVRLQERIPQAEEASEATVRRLAALQARFDDRPVPPPTLDVVGCDAHERLAQQVRERAGLA